MLFRHCLATAWAVALTAVCGNVPGAAEPAGALAEQQAPRPENAGTDEERGYYDGQDITRPENRFEPRVQYRSARPPGARSRQERTLLRVTSRLGLGAGWRLGLLSELPIVAQWTSTYAPSGSRTELGLADAVVQATLAHDIDRYWAIGFGARVEAPTAEDGLGTRQWQIMPGFGIRYSFVDLGPDTYFVPAIRYALGISGDPAVRNISEAQISPLLNIGLSDRWFLTLFPSFDVRVNFGTPVPGQAGKLFLPFDVAVGREIWNGTTLSLEVSVPVVRDFPVYDFKTELRMSARF